MQKTKPNYNEADPEVPWDEVCKDFKYKIYARKSTEDNGRQVRSIKDQIEDCRALAEKLELTVVGEPIRETKSAIEAGKRPLFNALLKELRECKIDGIIAWHPDRLARNAIESGKLIDLLDKYTIKDLRFHSHQFSNDPNGKMLLGMLFVFAKHYSDDLGFKVRRGVRKRHREGLSAGTPKHGYVQRGGVYTPDTKPNDNFTLIKNAWGMRAKGVKLTDISKYLTEKNYTKHYHPTDKDGSKYDEWRVPKMDDATLSKMFNDPFYYGVLVQADQETDLCNEELGLNFTPMVTEELWQQVREINGSSRRGIGKKNQPFLPCRDIVFCDLCHDTRPLTVYRSSSKKSKRYVTGKRYLYFKCKNRDCPRTKRDIRGHVIMDALEVAITQVVSRLTGDTYAKYLAETKELSSSAKKRLRSENIGLKGSIERLRKANDELAKQLPLLKDQRVIDEHNEKMSVNMNTIDKINKDIARNERKLEQTTAHTRKYTEQEFNDLIKNMAMYFKEGSLFQKDVIARNLFLNFYFDNEKVAFYTLREPFDALINVKNATKLSHGGGREIRTPAPGLPSLTI